MCGCPRLSDAFDQGGAGSALAFNVVPVLYCVFGDNSGGFLKGRWLMTTSTHPIVTLDDLVGSVFANYQKRYIPSRYAVLQRFFYDLSTSESLPNTVAELIPISCFELGDIFPYSRDIEASLVRLQIDGTLSAMNPDYERLVMDTGEKEEILDRSGSYDSDTREFIKRAAEQLTAIADTLGFE